MRARHILLFAILIAPTGHSQSQPERPTVRMTTSGVIIDVSVVDRNGHPVLDLTPADFQLSEEGKGQRLVSVTLVNGGRSRSLEGPDLAAPLSTPATSPSDTNPPAPEHTPTVTAILFDKLSPDSMPYGARAALACVSSLVPAQDYAGIFLVDVNFRTVQPFSTDPARLREAVERVARTATMNFRQEARRSGDVVLQKMDPNPPPTAGADSPGGFATVAERQRWLASLHPADKTMAEMTWRMEQAYRQIAVEYEGHTSIAALRAVVDALALLPGRKSVLYFTENLPVSDRLKPRFDAIIGYANRANITFYPVDAAGLRLHSKEAELGRNVSVAGAQGIGDAPREDGPWTKELERQNQLLISRPTAILGRLAKETGGFLIENTNDLGAGVARMQHERTAYYLLGYEPANATADGRFRRVTVKVHRRNVTVRARPGYLAVPAERR